MSSRMMCKVLAFVCLAACGRLDFDPLELGSGAGLGLVPQGPTMNVSSELTFTASGGTPPYGYAVVSGGGTIDAVTGTYFSPAARGSATIAATDAMGLIATSTVAYGGSQVFVLGGFVGGTSQTTVRASTDGVVWNQLSPGLPAMRDSGGAVVFRDAIYYIGGDSAGGPTTTVWRSTDGATFQQVGTLPMVTMSAAVVVHDQAIWVLGGYNGVSNIGEVWSSSDGSTWTARGVLPTARHESNAYERGGALYLVGGHDVSGYLTTIHVRNDATATWSPAGTVNLAADFQSGSDVSGLLLHGGGAGVTGMERSVDMVSWSPCSALTTPIQHPAIVDLNGEILVIGLGVVHHSSDCAQWTTTPYPDAVERVTGVQFTPR